MGSRGVKEPLVSLIAVVVGGARVVLGTCNCGVGVVCTPPLLSGRLVMALNSWFWMFGDACLMLLTISKRFFKISVRNRVCIKK